MEPNGSDALTVLGRTLLDEFERLRSTNLAFVRGLSLSPSQRALEGRHQRARPRDPRSPPGHLGRPELNHVAQVLRVMSARYGAAVGPWRRFLGILNR